MGSNNNKRGRLFVISGPSGAGKTTLARKLFKDIPSLVNSISATTRQPRKGEVNGKDYYFNSNDVTEELGTDDAVTFKIVQGLDARMKASNVSLILQDVEILES